MRCGTTLKVGERKCKNMNLFCSIVSYRLYLVVAVSYYTYMKKKRSVINWQPRQQQVAQQAFCYYTIMYCT